MPNGSCSRKTGGPSRLSALPSRTACASATTCTRRAGMCWMAWRSAARSKGCAIARAGNCARTRTPRTRRISAFYSTGASCPYPSNTSDYQGGSMGSSNNAQGQNAGARQQVNQQTTQAMQRLMMYLSQNPNPLQGAPAPTPPPGAPSGGALPGTAAPQGQQPRMGGMPAMQGGGQIGAP